MDEVGGEAFHQSNSSFGKLPLQSVPLVGRDEEIQILQEAYDRAAAGRIPINGQNEEHGINHNDNDDDDNNNTNNNNNNDDKEGAQVVIIEGKSGVGKSRLFKHAIGMINKVKRGRNQNHHDHHQTFVCCGKVDRASTEPFAALKQAFSELTDCIQNTQSEKERDDICYSIRKAIEGGGNKKNEEVLAQLVPGLEGVIGKGRGSHVSLRRDSETESQNALNRLKYLTRNFVKAVCQHRRIVFFLDDIQWADASTLDILESLLVDSQLNNFLFVGAHRPLDDHPLVIKTINKLPNLRQIYLGDLKISDVDEIVQYLTKLESDVTLPLSEIIHRKTQGNSFIVLEYIQMLVMQNLLVFSTMIFRWSFDLQKVEAKTFLADSVVAVVNNRIRTLSKQVQTLLKVLACLGSHFKIDSIHEILKEAADSAEELALLVDDGEGGLLENMLQTAVDNGLLDQLTDRKYKFAHDRIQESAYTTLFLDEEERNRMHLRLGRAVNSILNLHRANAGSPTQWMLFTCADQWNKGSMYVEGKDEILELAKLNLEAGQTAKTMSAFVPAKEYLKAGIDLLPSDGRWDDNNYQLTLELYTSFNEVSTCLGSYSESDWFAQEIIRFAKNAKDKMPVYRSQVDACAQQNKFKDAIYIAQTALKDLGVPMPKKAHMGQVLLDFFKTKRMLKGKSDEDLLSLPLGENANIAIAMEFLNRYAVHCVMLQRTADMLLVCMKNIQLTLKHGLYNPSPSAMCMYGIVIGSMGSISEAYRFGGISLRLLDKIDAGKYEAYCLQVATVFEMHWRESYYKCLETLQRGYEQGMATGDTEIAFYSGATYVIMYVLAGLNLVPVEKDCKSYCKQMLEYGREDNYGVGCPVWQFVLNLTGLDQSRDPSILTGTAMVEEEFVETYSSSKNIGALQTMWLFKARLCYYFGEYEAADNVLKEFEKTKASLAINYYVVMYAQYYGLNCLALARSTKKRKYVSAARKMIKLMTTWARDGNPNVPHVLLLLNAEYESLKENDIAKIRSLYDKAIVMSSRAGYLHDAALSNERAAICAGCLGDDFWAGSYAKQAYNMYTDWGAVVKAQQLAEKFDVIAVTETENGTLSTSRSTGHKGVARFDNAASDLHKSLPHLDALNYMEDSTFLTPENL